MMPTLRHAPPFTSVLLTLLLLLRTCAPAPAATVVGSVQNSFGQSYGGAVNKLTYTPLSAPQQIGTNTIWPVAVTQKLTNGTFTTTLVGGLYWTGLEGDNLTTGAANKTIKILVPPDDGTYAFNDCASWATNLGTFTWTNSPATTTTNLSGHALTQVTNIAAYLAGQTNANTPAYGAYIWLAQPDGSLNVNDTSWWLTNGILALPGTTVAASAFTGDGSGLTNLPGSSGTATNLSGAALGFFRQQTSKPRKIVVFDDYGADSDNDEKLQFLLCLERLGLIELLAAFVDSWPYDNWNGTTSTASAYNSCFATLQNIIRWNGSCAALGRLTNFTAPYWAPVSSYINIPTGPFAMTTFPTNVPSATAELTRLLEAAETNSVTLLLMGPPRTFADFWATSAGKTLVSNKVSEIVAVTHFFPNSQKPGTSITNGNGQLTKTISSGDDLSNADFDPSNYYFWTNNFGVQVTFEGEELSLWGNGGNGLDRWAKSAPIRDLVTGTYVQGVGVSAILYLAFGTNITGTNFISFSTPGSVGVVTVATNGWTAAGGVANLKCSNYWNTASHTSQRYLTWPSAAGVSLMTNLATRVWNFGAPPVITDNYLTNNQSSVNLGAVTLSSGLTATAITSDLLDGAGETNKLFLDFPGTFSNYTASWSKLIFGFNRPADLLLVSDVATLDGVIDSLDTSFGIRESIRFTSTGVIVASNLNVGGAITTTNTYYGNGSGITNLYATNVVSPVLTGLARYSANTNCALDFAQGPTFVTMTNSVNWLHATNLTANYLVRKFFLRCTNSTYTMMFPSSWTLRGTFTTNKTVLGQSNGYWTFVAEAFGNAQTNVAVELIPPRN